MNDTATRSILQRLPKILAVTAASYGLPLQSRSERLRVAARNKGVAERHQKNQPRR